MNITNKKILIALLSFSIIATAAFAGCNREPDWEDLVDEWADDYDYSEWEMNDYEALESFEVPAGFPSEFVYDDGKVTGYSDWSDSYGLSLNVSMQTPDGASDVRSFYSNTLSDPEWEISAQSVDSYGSSFSADHTDGPSVSISISNYGSSMSYIDVWYSEYENDYYGF